MANIWRWTVAGTDASGLQEWNSTMHWQTDGSIGSDEPTAQEIHDNLLMFFSTGGTGSGMERWLATVQDGVKLTRTSTYQELAATDTSVPEAYSANHTFNGAVSVIDPATPFALCPFIKFTTGFASRSSRGGTHLSPSLDQNHLTSAGLFDTTLSWWSAVISLAAYMKTQLNMSSWSPAFPDHLNPIIYSRTRRNLTLTPYTFQLTGATPSATPRWLRRRDVGR